SPVLSVGTSARLAELPDGAFGGVGELDAELVELGADLVGAGPVALLAGLGPVLDEFGDGVLFLVGQVGERAAVLQVGGVAAAWARVSTGGSGRSGWTRATRRRRVAWAASMAAVVKSSWLR